MNDLTLIANCRSRVTARMRAAHPVPAQIAASGDRASLRFLEFFVANIRNPHTRRAYHRAVAEFLAWCDDQGVPSVAAVQPTSPPGSSCSSRRA